MKISIRLEDLMWEKRVKSINYLSEQTGLSRATLTRMKNNESKAINLETAETICKYLGCELDELFYTEKEVV